jgi:2-methylisocitrate lyase-like PEP mutase family enzyme
MNLEPETNARARGAAFRELHSGPDLLLLANAWDAGSARLLEAAGFRALATTSAGVAFTLGRRDGDGALSRDETLDITRAIVDAVHVPVTADLENGFGDTPEHAAETIRRAGAVGLSGGSIEDATFRPDAPILPLSLAVERIHAAVEAARTLPHPFVLTARAENFIRGRPHLDDTLRRLEAFERAGADVLFAPGLPNRQALEDACRSFAKPINYVVGCGPTRFTLAELREIGVRRVSVGATLIRHAFESVRRAAHEMLNVGTFDYLERLPSFAEVNTIMRAPSE